MTIRAKPGTTLSFMGGEEEAISPEEIIFNDVVQTIIRLDGVYVKKNSMFGFSWSLQCIKRLGQAPTSNDNIDTTAMFNEYTYEEKDWPTLSA